LIRSVDQAMTLTSVPALASRDFSETNNQVKGVDEADMLKTDGTYIYTISNQKLVIVQAYPAEKARVVSTVNLDQQYPSALFVEGDFLAIFGSDYSTGYSTTFIKIYNIKNRSNPTLR